MPDLPEDLDVQHFHEQHETYPLYDMWGGKQIFELPIYNGSRVTALEAMELSPTMKMAEACRCLLSEVLGINIMITDHFVSEIMIILSNHLTTTTVLSYL